MTALQRLLPVAAPRWFAAFWHEAVFRSSDPHRFNRSKTHFAKPYINRCGLWELLLHNVSEHEIQDRRGDMARTNTRCSLTGVKDGEATDRQSMQARR